jgi:hypothetical protein
MEISFQLKEADLMALAKFQTHVSDYLFVLTRRRRLLYIIGFGIMSVGGLLSGSVSTAIAFASLGVIAYLVAPSVSRRIAYSSIPRVLRSKERKNALGAKTINAAEASLIYQSEHSRSELNWILVDDIADTEDYIFISIDGAYTFVIPKSEVDVTQLTKFLDVLRSRIIKTDA